MEWLFFTSMTDSSETSFSVSLLGVYFSSVELSGHFRSLKAIIFFILHRISDLFIFFRRYTVVSSIIECGN